MSGPIVKPSGKLFKHDCIFTGYGEPYLDYDSEGVVDGIGRQHINLYGRCDICNERVHIAMIHVDKDGKLYPKKDKK